MAQLSDVHGPTKSELAQMLRTMSYAAVGRQYGVSAYTARQWAHIFGLYSPRSAEAKQAIRVLVASQRKQMPPR